MLRPGRSRKNVRTTQSENPLESPTAARQKRRATIAWSLTGGWVVAFVVGVLLKRGDVPAMSLNEWGDYIAGAAAPLALFWLVIGYYQHGEELRLNTKALEAQQRELHQQARETAQLVTAARRELAYRQEIDAKTVAPRFEYEQTQSYAIGLGISFRNLGAEVFNVRVNYHGPHEPHANPMDSMERNEKMELMLRPKGNAPIYPIRWSVTYVDRLGNEHEKDYIIAEPGGVMEQVFRLNSG